MNLFTSLFLYFDAYEIKLKNQLIMLKNRLLLSDDLSCEDLINFYNIMRDLDIVRLIEREVLEIVRFL